MNPVINKITHYMYQFICDDYDINQANAYIRKLENSTYMRFPFGCSTIRNGSFLGRNFDFFYSNLIDFIIQVPHSHDHYASIGMGCTIGECTTENIHCGISDEICNVIPFCVWDGINEKGVTFSTNVVTSADLDCQTTGTNPCKPLLYSTFIGRVILDHAGSAREAIEILKNHNIVTPGIMPLQMTHDLHFMIADEQDTFVVEFINNKLVCRKNEKIMTNFYLSLPLQPHSCGLERYGLMKKNYDCCDGMDRMSNLMKQLHYRKTYDLCTNPFWYSEYVSSTAPDGTDITVFNMKHYACYIRELARNVSFEKRGGLTSPWHTMHTSIYDIHHKRLRIYSQENYETCFEFSLNLIM